MSSAAKTLALLSLFSTKRPEIGLSELCRLAGRDKATTYRHLQVLEEAGFVEQTPETKRYRLGPAVLQLAQTRELTVPRKESAMPALSRLAIETGETAHVSELSGTTLYALASCESSMHSTRVIIDIQTFPLHATASGLCALAFGPPDLIDVAASRLQVFTSTTVKTVDELARTVESVGDTGFGHTNSSFEQDVHSLAAPVFDQTGRLAGCVSVASVASRCTSYLVRRIQENLMQASRDITRNWGGTIPDSIEASWARSLNLHPTLEPAS
ncbi:IclR family transcriptional regulator [Phaeobacter marinintestinus]|uniref:IclR family transcriptional regulator n=1 Tax=Falsiphaeobacter marinintestinus TaxID=1492905 RepID=UPI0011B7EE4B|nr:IclR family transcriptional regulator [Phaeobacter marinintestinus]